MKLVQITKEETIIVKRTNIMAIQTTNIEEKCVFIKISRTGSPQGMSPEALYNAVRKEWRANINHIATADYVMAIYNNDIVEVYRPIDWYVNIKTKRVMFEGQLAPFDIRQKYIGLHLPALEGVRRPVVYNF